MDKQQIKQLLRQINLNLDIDTVGRVESFLVNDVGFITQIQLEYQVYGAVAIVSETLKLQNVGHFGLSKNGIKIQNVMSHLGQLSKQKFLDTLNKQLQKLKKAPQNLKKRIQDIRYSYRFYKKYQATFESLYQKLNCPKYHKQDFSALFWIVYLYIKNTCIQTQNITESRTLLILLLRIIFENFIWHADFDDIFGIMQKNIGAIPEISVEKHQFYLKQVEQKIKYFYNQRFTPQARVNFAKLIENQLYLERLLDDMSNDYAKEQGHLRYCNQIDELSYLELKKNLTPQVFKKPIQNVQSVPAISKKLFDFDQEQEPDVDQQIDQQVQIQIESTPSKQRILQGTDGLPTAKTIHNYQNVSPSSTPTWNIHASPKISSFELLKDSPISTPITKKVQNQKWMKQRINSITENNLLELDFRFKQIENEKSIMLQKPSQTFSEYLKPMIYQMIKDFTPKCQNYGERFNKIMAFIAAIFKEIKNQNNFIFQTKEDLTLIQRQRMIGIAALSCEIFNYIHNSISYEFKHHYEAFKITGHVAIDAFDLFDRYIEQQMPYDLKNYLKKTKKRFFVGDIWQNEEGFKIISKLNVQFEPNSTQKKIISQTQERVRQICRQAKIESKIVSKTLNMIRFIFDKKPYLLKNNNIDQIILCCLMSCLSINQKEEQKTLETLFCEYNSHIEFSFNSNQIGLKDHQGNSMKIVDYYNEVFLNQIQDMLAQKQDQLDEFLLTPVRITNQYKSLNSSGFENFSRMKQKRPQLDFMFNPELMKKRTSEYRMSLIKQNSNTQMKEEKQQDEEDLESPRFGRIISFMNLPDK